jgi:hypothetical protein
MAAHRQRGFFRRWRQLIDDRPVPLLASVILGGQILKIEMLGAGLILKPLQIIIMIHSYAHDLQNKNVTITVKCFLKACH